MNVPTKLAFLLTAVIALGLSPSNPVSVAAGDNCLYDCEGSTCYDYGNHSDFCGDLRAKCSALCSGRRWWGAIAYSVKDMGYGFSFEFNREEDAKNEAMRRCKLQGTACQIWATFENECGAIAADGQKAAWGTAFLRETAQRRAIEECRKAGGKNCSIQVWVCSKM